MHAPEKNDNGNCIHVILGKFQSIKKLSILPYPAFYPIHILPCPHFTPSAFYPIHIIPYLHFTFSAFYPIGILPYPHFTLSALSPICILPCPHFTHPHFTHHILPIRILPIRIFPIRILPYPIRILPDPHFTRSAFYLIHILPNTKPHARFFRFPFSERSTIVLYGI